VELSYNILVGRYQDRFWMISHW